VTRLRNGEFVQSELRSPRSFGSRWTRKGEPPDAFERKAVTSLRSVPAVQNASAPSGC
jgi:hypothetical protein